MQNVCMPNRLPAKRFQTKKKQEILITTKAKTQKKLYTRKNKIKIKTQTKKEEKNKRRSTT